MKLKPIGHEIKNAMKGAITGNREILDTWNLKTFTVNEGKKKKHAILKDNCPFVVDLFLGGDIWFIPWSCISACPVILDWTECLFHRRQALQRRRCRLGQQQKLLIARTRQSSHEINCKC